MRGIRSRHGMAGTKVYIAWRDMLTRCMDPRNKFYSRYGGRGITVCERWRKFTNFLEDMGVGGEGLSLDRIDNDSGYSKSNCYWSTKEQQASNTSRTVRITFNGETLPRSEWERRLGLRRGAIAYRMRLGETPPYALRPSRKSFCRMGPQPRERKTEGER